MTNSVKFYFCESDNADECVSKVTECDTPEQALDLAQNSTADVHFISTINPLADEDAIFMEVVDENIRVWFVPTEEMTMTKQIPDENIGLWFTTFRALIKGGCPEEQAKAAADIVATDDYSKGLDCGRSESDQALIRDTLKYLQGDIE